MTARLLRLRFLGLLVAGIWIVLDQISKTWAQSNLMGHPRFLFGHVGFELIYNSGFAFGIASGSSAIITIFGLIVSAGLIFALWRTSRRTIALGIGLVLGGALGNVVDRLFRHNGGAVIDFIHSGFWPTFNLADMGVVVGLIVIMVGSRQRQASSSSNR